MNDVYIDFQLFFYINVTNFDDSAVPDLSPKQDTVHQAFAENKPEVTTTKMTEVKVKYDHLTISYTCFIINSFECLLIQSKKWEQKVTDE